MFTSFTVKNGIAVGLGGDNSKHQLTPEQQETIRHKLDYIDTLLKKDCPFCGPLLIDMIDNDIVGSDTKMFEFFSPEETETVNQYGAPGNAFDQDLEWEID